MEQRNLRRSLLAAILSAVTTFCAAAPTISGNYDGLLIGVDRQGTVTGYFESSTGNGQFNCIFFFTGKLGSSTTRVDSWFPGDRDPKEVISGTIAALVEEGMSAVRVTLKEEHGGCWNVQHFASEPASFKLTEEGAWQSVRVVSAKRSYFYNDSSGARARKAYVVQGNALRVFELQSGWVRAEYINPEGKRTQGWISERDLYLATSPAKK